MKKIFLYCFSLFVLANGLWAGSAYADLVPGSVITAANLEQNLSQKFEGVPLGDMLTESQKIWIKQYGLKVTLAAPKENPVSASFIANTKRFSGQVKLNPQTLRVENFVAGMPFPDVAVDDPLGGRKLMWNYYYSALLTGDSIDSSGIVMLVSSTKGLERVSSAENYRFILKGRGTEPHDISNGGPSKILMAFLTSPYDLAGVGAYIERPDNGGPDQTYIYLKSLRRIRRVSGQTYADPFLASDLLGEDTNMFDSNPLWYPGMKIIGKRKLLVVANGAPLAQKDRGRGEAYINLAAPPYWNPSIDYKWEPREVYVIEVTPKESHPYSKKLVYMDVHWPIIWQVENFNRAGKLWKMVMDLYYPLKQGDGEPGIMISHIYTIDWQAAHATVIGVPPGLINRPGAKLADYSYNRMADALNK